MDLDDRPLVILGARSQAPVVADWVSAIPGVRITHFVENLERERCETTLHGLPVLWIDEVKSLTGTHAGICALGSPGRSRFIEQVAAFGLPFATAIHPSAVVSRQDEIDEGSIVSPGVVIAAFTTIGRHVFINRGALIGHDVEIGNYVTIGPGANIAGFSRVGTATHVGMGAVILDRIKVGAGSVVAAGSVVNKDVPDDVTVAGAPARIVRHR